MRGPYWYQTADGFRFLAAAPLYSNVAFLPVPDRRPQTVGDGSDVPEGYFAEQRFVRTRLESGGIEYHELPTPTKADRE